MAEYLPLVASGRLPVNNTIVYNLQNIFNLLPNLSLPELVRSMHVQSNDFYMAIYMSALVRSIVALHDLLDNKLKYRDEDEVPGDENVKNGKPAGAAGAGSGASTTAPELPGESKSSKK
jgi:26S proteasome regulatory subunit N8